VSWSASFIIFFTNITHIAILKINGDELLQATDDGAFMNVLKQYFSNLDKPLYPNSDNPKAKNLTVTYSKKKITSLNKALSLCFIEIQ
jgi:hypothetical protein